MALHHAVRFARRIAAAALAGAVASCTPAVGGSPNASRTLHMGAAVAPNSFNPLLTTESIENYL